MTPKIGPSAISVLAGVFQRRLGEPLRAAVTVDERLDPLESEQPGRRACGRAFAMQIG